MFAESRRAPKIVVSWIALTQLWCPASYASNLTADHRVFEKDLEGWLANVKLYIPDGTIQPILTKISLLVTEAEVNIKVNSLVCDNIGVGTLREHSLHGLHERAEGGLSSSQGHNEVYIRADKLAITCHGTVSYSSSVGVEGTADAKVDTDDASLSMNMRFESSDNTIPKIPNMVVLEDCKSQLNLKLHVVSGSGWTQFAELVSTEALKSRLQDAVNKEISHYLCKDGVATVKGIIDPWLQGVHAISEQYMTAYSSDAPKWNASYVNWEEVSLFQWLTRFQQEYMNTRGIYDRMLNHFWPNKHVCILGNGTFCLHEAFCALGGNEDNDCVVAASLVRDPPAVLRMQLEDMDVSISNLTNVTILEPHNTSWVSHGFARNVEMRMVFNITFNGWAGGAQAKDLTGKIGIKLLMEEVDVENVLFAGLDKEAFTKVPSYRYVYPQCVAPSLRDVQLTNFSAAFQIVNTSMKVLGDSLRHAPLFIEFMNLTGNVLQALATYDRVFVSALDGYLRSNLTASLTERINQYISKIQKQECPEPQGQETDGGKKSPLIYPEFALKCLYVAMGLSIMSSLFASGHFVNSRLGRHLPDEQLPEPSLNFFFWFHDSLCNCATVSRPIAVFILLAIFACTFFLLGSNYLLMAETFVNLEVNGRSIYDSRSAVQVYQVMPFSLWYSIDRLMSIQELRPLAYVVLAFSGVLPYTKLFLMMFAWLAPTRVLSTRLRGRILFIMDQIGKFSLIDIFVIQFISGILYTVVDLRDPKAQQDFTLQDPNTTSALQDRHLAVVLRTNTEPGFTAFVLATVGSLIVGHFCLHCHEKDPCVRSIRSQPGSPAHSASMQRSAREVGRSLHGEKPSYVGPMLLLTIALMIVGCSLNAFTVNLRSPFGKFSTASYSIFTFLDALPAFAEDPNSFRTRFGQFTYLTFVIVIVYMHLAILLVAWFTQVPHKWLRAFHRILHSLSAWSSLDVALLGMFMTAIEMTTSDLVDLKPAARQQLSLFSGIEITDERGLIVDVACGLGAYILVLSVLLHAWIGWKVMNSTEIKVHIQDVSNVGSLELFAAVDDDDGYIGYATDGDVGDDEMRNPVRQRARSFPSVGSSGEMAAMPSVAPLLEPSMHDD